MSMITSQNAAYHLANAMARVSSLVTLTENFSILDSGLLETDLKDIEKLLSVCSEFFAQYDQDERIS
jgi:hypothetical protein